MGSPGIPPPDVHGLLRQFEIQRNWLRNVRPPSRGVCPVCRGPRESGYQRCFPCGQAETRSGRLLATAVVPVSYSPHDGQHYHQLKAYKSPSNPNALAQLRLTVLCALFVRTHRACLESVAGGPFTHFATVPSTRQRAGVHPLLGITGPARGPLPLIPATADPAFGNAREFVPERFRVLPSPLARAPARVLLVDDLWVTGARAQAMAHALRRSGAVAVVVALGRQMNRGHPPSRQLLDLADRNPFDLDRCALDDLAG